jgi:hypothetical protein
MRWWRLDRGLTAGGLRLQLARVHDHVRDVLAAAGETGLIDAVELQRR